jgi:thioredoxin reductase (NADPH)
MKVDKKVKTVYDIIIIGAGPAGMTAALYAKQARKNILVLEKEVYGGQILKADNVKNYPGFKEISGYDFANNLYTQLTDLNVEIKFEEVMQINSNEEYKEVKTKKGNYLSKSVIIAAGAKNRKLNLNNEDRLIGKGISYCTTCDGMFFKDKVVAVYGGGNSAIDGAIYLSDICKKVYLIYRQKDFKENGDNVNKLKNTSNIECIFNTNIIDLIGETKLESLKLKTNAVENILNVDGLFIDIGYIPVSEICSNLVNTDSKGYIIANEDCTTNVEGIFAAGDIRIKDIRQLTTACSDGTVAALNACKYIAKKNTD